jgi:hypothetical protein
VTGAADAVWGGWLEQAAKSNVSEIAAVIVRNRMVYHH